MHLLASAAVMQAGVETGVEILKRFFGGPKALAARLERGWFHEIVADNQWTPMDVWPWCCLGAAVAHLKALFSLQCF